MASNTSSSKEKLKCKHCWRELEIHEGMPTGYVHVPIKLGHPCPGPYPEPMEVTKPTWKEKLKGRCRHCKQLVIFHERSETKWRHVQQNHDMDCIGFNSFGESPKVNLHGLTLDEVRTMGHDMGLAGASHADNPYLSSGLLFDGADSMAEAIVWWKGWRDVSGYTPPAIVQDGFDFLEDERG